MKKFFEEFKKFISKGNVVDMAVGIVVGSAFTKIVNSIVSDIITPLISLLIGNLSFNDLKIVFKAATEESSEVALTYGNLIEAIINFIIIAFSMFCVIKAINAVKERMERAEKEKLAKEAAEKAEAEKLAAEEAEAARKAEEERLAAIPTREELLLTEIRDLLSKKYYSVHFPMNDACRQSKAQAWLSKSSYKR